MNNNELLTAALAYADTGLAVFPVFGVNPETLKCDCGDSACRNIGKHPNWHLVPTGVHEATTDAATITNWWTESPTSNVAIATGGVSNLVVIDVDRDKGGDVDALRDIVGGNLDTLRVTTGGGFHFYYTYADWQAFDIRNSVSMLAAKIDVRGSGGYVVAAPSLHASGKHYDADTSQPVAPLPAGVLKAIKTLASRRASGERPNAENRLETVPLAELFIPATASGGLVVPGEIDQGMRNNELTRLAGSMRRQGFSEGAIINAIAVENERICKPPLDKQEVFDIARSVGRYKPHVEVGEVSEPTGPYFDDYSLKPRLLSQLLGLTFDPKEIIAFHLGKRDIGLFQGATNAGKTTFLRNAAISMAAGRPFAPFVSGHRPCKVAYFDFENDEQDVHGDLTKMCDVLSPSELSIAGQNLIVVPKGMLHEAMFQFNTHEDFVRELLIENGVEFAIIDNISAAYDINDENSNAEVTKKIIKPLTKLAMQSNCAFLFAHHYGKGKPTDEENKSATVGRGASAIPSLSRAVFNITGDVSDEFPEPSRVHCVKNKNNGGRNYKADFELKIDLRWFVPSEIRAVAPKPKTARDAVMDLFKNHPDAKMMLKDLHEPLSAFTPDNLKKAVQRLFDEGYLTKPSRGVYQWNDDDDETDAP